MVELQTLFRTAMGTGVVVGCAAFALLLAAQVASVFDENLFHATVHEAGHAFAVLGNVVVGLAQELGGSVERRRVFRDLLDADASITGSVEKDPFRRC